MTKETHPALEESIRENKTVVSNPFNWILKRSVSPTLEEQKLCWSQSLRKEVFKQRKMCFILLQKADLNACDKGLIFKLAGVGSIAVCRAQETVVIALGCAGNTKGSGASSSDKTTQQLYWQVLQLTGHTSPAYVSLQQPLEASKDQHGT